MTTVATTAQRNTDGALVRAGVGAAVAAATVNTVLYGAAVAAGIFPTLRLDRASGSQMAVELVVFSSLVGVAAGMGFFALLQRYAGNPLCMFYWIAGVVLVTSFAAPFTMPGTVVQAMTLNVMHVVAAASVLWAVRRAATRRAVGHSAF
jgi:hypothetical protein